MKMKLKSRSRLLLLSLIFLNTNCQSIGQVKFYSSLGLGLPESFNLGVGVQAFQQFRFGVNAGILPGGYTVSGNAYYHFAGSGSLSSQRLWYGNAAFNYYHEENDYNIFNSGFLTTRIGRDLKISNRFGFFCEAGISYEIYEKNIEKRSTWLSGMSLLDFKLWPSFAFGASIRF
jgi:hypothetical protein